MALDEAHLPSSAPVDLEVCRDRLFLDEVCRRSGTPVRRCYQCRGCGNGCPFVEAMDHPPYVVLRLVQFGLRQPALESSTIWICAGCQTCSNECPMGLDISAVMKTLCHLALEEQAAVAAPDILQFHQEVVRSIEHHGRVHKLGIMMRYKLLTGQWFSDMETGLKMLARRKLDLRPSRIENPAEIGRLFRPFWKVK